MNQPFNDTKNFLGQFESNQTNKKIFSCDTVNPQTVYDLPLKKFTNF